MRTLRSRLFWVAALTLSVQIAGLAIAPAALCCLPGAEQKMTMNCCKDAGAGHVCPLMKKKGGPPPSGASLRACCSAEDQIFTALLGFMGVPAPLAPVLGAPPVSIVPGPAVSDVVAWLAPVDSPPPRN